MIRQEFAAGYRKTAQVWRRRAAEMRSNSLFNAEQVARMWESTAEAFELRAAEIEGTDTP